MSIEPLVPGAPAGVPQGPRDPGDAWVVSPSGERYWGRFGAAGLLALDVQRGVLLQHRVSWSHFGGTWALPGGARHESESAIDGALRESYEEAGVPDVAVRPRFISVFELDYWSYATVVADVVTPFEPVISDPESYELLWVPVDDVASYPLHPAFEQSWAQLRPLLSLRPSVVIDVANVMGATPDGWWRDRAGAADRLVARLAALASRGVTGDSLELPERTWFPSLVAVVEGQARGISAVDGIDVVHAEASGDDAIVAEVSGRVDAGEVVTVVTSDRELSERVTMLGAAVHGARWLLDLLGTD
ncbi:NUDIX domain-containing protein (plasmid) [Coraliomargarita sp. W4R53]